MVSNYMLNEIFGKSEDILFSGISILAFGDFYQLPPIDARSFMENIKILY